ncbi:MAG: hypothetical protein ACKOW9_05520 [Candidatus Paceibacterota bacterium]
MANERIKWYEDIFAFWITSRSMERDEFLSSWDNVARLYSGRVREVASRGNVDEMGGWKVALIKNPYNGLFKGLAFGEYGCIESRAVCERDSGHRPPVVGCECGFHAHRYRYEAERYLGRRRGLVLVNVELYGDVVVHKEGYRGQEQDVIAVYLNEVCRVWFCRGKSVGIMERRGRWEERCDNHLDVGLSLNEFRKVCGYEVLFR